MLNSKSIVHDPEGTIRLSQVIGALKNTKRAGWVSHNIARSESVADHSFGVALLAMFLAKYFDMDSEKAVRMALIHDLGEASIGDIITQCGDQVIVDEAEKNRVERDALLGILEGAGNAEDITLFDEYLERRTPEAQFVHQLDKLEMAFQARWYEQEQKLVLEEFMTNTKKHVSNELLRGVLDILLQTR